MAEIVDKISNFFLSPWLDKKYSNDKGEKIAISFMLRRELTKGTFQSNELEFQDQNKKLQFRANPDNAVTLGTLLNRVFDVEESELSDLYVVMDGEQGKNGVLITDNGSIRDFDLCNAMVDKKSSSGYYIGVTLIVSYRKNYCKDEHKDKSVFREKTNMVVYLECSGNNEDTQYFRASMMLPIDDGDINYARTMNEPKSINVLFAYDHTEPQKRIIKFEKDLKKAVKKYQKGKSLNIDEQCMIAKIVPEILWNYSWGNQAFQEHRYWDAILYLENVYHGLKESWLKGEIIDEERYIFFQTCYMIGFSYADMGLHEKACYYLDIIWPLEEITYCREYINCLVNLKDVRAKSVINSELERLKQLMNDEKVDNEIDDTFVSYFRFLRRRKAHVLVDINKLDEAEKIFRELLQDEKQETVIKYIEGELKYIDRMRTNK